MAVQTRAIKRRIKSVHNTRKITKAMEMVAASKMRKAVQAVLASRAFARLAWDTVGAISRLTDTSAHPLLAKRESGKTLMVLLTSDRGLAGGFNGNMVKRALVQLASLGQDDVEVICLGKRGGEAMRRAGKNIVASFTDLTNNPKFSDILPIGRLIVDEFLQGKYARVYLGYTDFVSAITQKPLVLELLPLGSPETLRPIGEVAGAKEEKPKAGRNEYLFEPNPQAVLDRLLPRLIETTLYQALLESAASEHSARMLAMRSATDAAQEMIDSLTFSFNQARQAAITQEIAEISGGKAALENSN